LGWTYLQYLNYTLGPEANYMVSAPISLLRGAPDGLAPIVSRLAGGTGVRVSDITPSRTEDPSEAAWTRLALAGGLEGWVPLADLRALDAFPTDGAAQRRQMVEDASRLTGVPYLWGGSTAMSIDCSGMVQLLYRLVGLTIPRDADMQYDSGRRVEPPFQAGDLLFFGSEGAQRSITHVGMSVGGWQMVHSSRARNGVYEDDVQAVTGLRESFVGACTFLEPE
jgi:cell wall-associated NlpC family hydrolase